MSDSKEFKISEVLSYLSNPQYVIPCNYSFISNLKYLLWSYFTCILGILISGAIIIFVDKILVSCLGISSVYQEIKESAHNIRHLFGSYTFLMVIFIGPFLEELAFRLPLNLKISSIALAIAIWGFKFSRDFLLHFDIFNRFNSVSLIFFLLVFIIANKYLSTLSIIKNIKDRYFKYYFYGIVFIFGLVHITNLKNIDYKLFLIYPVFVLPQIVMGLLIGNIRMQRGFFWGFLLHALINSNSFIFS